MRRRVPRTDIDDLWHLICVDEDALFDNPLERSGFQREMQFDFRIKGDCVQLSYRAWPHATGFMETVNVVVLSTKANLYAELCNEQPVYFLFKRSAFAIPLIYCDESMALKWLFMESTEHSLVKQILLLAQRIARKRITEARRLVS